MREKEITRTLQLVRSVKNNTQAANDNESIVPSLEEMSFKEIVLRAFRHKKIVFGTFFIILGVCILLFVFVGSWYERVVVAEINNYENNSLFKLLDTLVPINGSSDQRGDDREGYATRALNALDSDEFIFFCYDSAKKDPEIARIMGIVVDPNAERPDLNTYYDMKGFFKHKLLLEVKKSTDISSIIGSKDGGFTATFKEKNIDDLEVASKLFVRLMSDFVAQREVADISSTRHLVTDRIAAVHKEIGELTDKRVAIQSAIFPATVNSYDVVEQALQSARSALAGNKALEEHYSTLVDELQHKFTQLGAADRTLNESELLRQSLAGLSYQQEQARMQGMDEQSRSMKQTSEDIAATAKKLKELAETQKQLGVTPSQITDDSPYSQQLTLNEQLLTKDYIKDQNHFYAAKSEKLGEILGELRVKINDGLSKAVEGNIIQKQIDDRLDLASSLERALIRLDLSDYKTLRRMEFYSQPIEDGGILPLPAFMLFSLLLSTLGGVFVGFMRERKNPSLTTVRSFEEFGIPVLGGIPPTETFLMRSLESANEQENEQSLSYVRVALNLGNVMTYIGSKISLFTSADSARQSATILYNLSTYFARTGRKVLIVESDFHNNYISKLTGASIDGGLNDVLADKVEVNLKPSNIEKNLDVLTGNKSHLPAIYRLASENFLDLLDELKKDYDYIFVHTRPCLESPEAADLSRYAGVSIICGDARTLRISWLERLTVEMRLFLSKYSYFIIEAAADQTTSYNQSFDDLSKGKKASNDRHNKAA